MYTHSVSAKSLLTHLLVPPPPVHATGPPKDVPPPTPVHFPECRPRPAKSDRVRPDPNGSDSEVIPSDHLVTLLQSLVRPADQVKIVHLEALGVQVCDGCSLLDLIPDPDCVPDFDEWDKLSREDAHAKDAETRVTLCNGKLAPGATKYVELRQGLLTENERAFRAVRRVAPKPGEQYVRLGYCHEFFRHLETFTGFWEDTSVTKPSASTDEKPPVDGIGPSDCGSATETDYTACYRTSAGSSMPTQYRTQLLVSFLKLVTYDFSCNVMGRQEPRLHMKSPAPTDSQKTPSPPQRHSYFSSGCNFIYRMPVDRESAKLGIIEGPIAAVSPRHMTAFPPVGREREPVIDLSRELIAALITAQHRAREGKQEVRVGKDAWWTTRRRWGGGCGGPIGREAELLESQDGTPAFIGDKDEPPTAKATLVEGDPTKDMSSPQTPSPSTPSSRRSYKTSFERVMSGSPTPGGSSPTQPPSAKRARKSLAIYDAYRMVRPPSMHWDPKTRYAAIGRTKGADYDDVFVISCLFHHISILRVRVPDQLLVILDGAAPDPSAAVWGGLCVWRTRWYDFFVAPDRVEAMKAMWSIVAYAMRYKAESEGEDKTTTNSAKKSTAADGEGEGKKGSPRR